MLIPSSIPSIFQPTTRNFRINRGLYFAAYQLRKDIFRIVARVERPTFGGGSSTRIIIVGYAWIEAFRSPFLFFLMVPKHLSISGKMSILCRHSTKKAKPTLPVSRPLVVSIPLICSFF